MDYHIDHHYVYYFTPMKERWKNMLKMSERRIWIKKAREQYQDGGSIEIDNNAEISKSDEGAYVQAWVWLPNEEEETI